MMQPFTATMATSVYTEQFCQFFLFFGVRSLYGSFSTKGLNRASLIGPLFLGQPPGCAANYFYLAHLSYSPTFFSKLVGETRCMLCCVPL